MTAPEQWIVLPFILPGPYSVRVFDGIPISIDGSFLSLALFDCYGRAKPHSFVWYVRSPNGFMVTNYPVTPTVSLIVTAGLGNFAGFCLCCSYC